MSSVLGGLSGVVISLGIGAIFKADNTMEVVTSCLIALTGILTLTTSVLSIIAQAQRSNDSIHWKRMEERAPLVREKYPDVPIYPTVKAALKEHPLTRLQDKEQRRWI
jgi:hypothetical protein